MNCNFEEEGLFKNFTVYTSYRPQSEGGSLWDVWGLTKETQPRYFYNNHTATECVMSGGLESKEWAAL